MWVPQGMSPTTSIPVFRISVTIVVISQSSNWNRCWICLHGAGVRDVWSDRDLAHDARPDHRVIVHVRPKKPLALAMLSEDVQFQLIARQCGPLR
jgi:hypothetical protein